MSQQLDLSVIRDQLIRLEETIIFALIERAQFPINKPTYIPGALTTKFDVSFLDFFLRETEKVHSLMRRYTCPEEHPFTDWSELPDPIILRDDYPAVLKPNNVNINKKVMSIYLEKIIPMICQEGDREYGSSSTCDISALQAISKRVHYGKFVVESKFQQDVDGYTRLVAARDHLGIMKKLTDEVVEAKLLERVRLKASTYGQDPAQNGARVYKVDPAIPVQIYKDFLIPLTKEVELEYVLRRLDGFSIAFFGPSGSLSHVAAKDHFSSSTTSFIPYGSIPQVFSAVLSTKSDYGVVPIYNTTSGLFRVTHELLFMTELKITAEVNIRAKLQLLSVEPDLSRVTKIYSHPDAIAQCQKSLLLYCPAVRTIPVSSTSEGAERACNEPGSAAIAHLEVQRLFPTLRILQTDIHDDDKAVTRFLVLSKSINLPTPTGRDKTLLVFGMNDRPGALSAALGAFDKHGINLTSIESHFKDGNPLFLIEFVGHVHDEIVRKALKVLESHTNFINVIGSFQASTPIRGMK